MDIKITEVGKNANYKNNLVINSDFLTLLNDYENLKTKLHNHNYVLEQLTQKVLKLNTFKKQKVTGIKLPNFRNKIKNICIPNGHDSIKDELSIIKKLLTINLRSLQIIERLYEENYDLKILLDKSYQFVVEQKKQSENIMRENKNLREDEKHFKTGLETFFNKLDNISDKILLQTGRQECFIPQYYARKKSPEYDHKNYHFSSETAALIKKSSHSSNNTLYHSEKITKLIQLYKEMFHYYDLKMALKNLGKDIMPTVSNIFQNGFNFTLPKDYIFNKIESIDYDDSTDNLLQTFSVNKINSLQLELSHDFESIKNTDISKMSENSNWSSYESFSFRGNIQGLIYPFTVVKFKTKNKLRKIEESFILRGECIDIQLNINSFSLSIDWKDIKEYLFRNISIEKEKHMDSIMLNCYSIKKNNTFKTILCEKINNNNEDSNYNTEVNFAYRDEFSQNKIFSEKEDLNINLKVNECHKFIKNMDIGVGHSSPLLLDRESQVNIDFSIEAPNKIIENKQDTNLAPKINKKIKIVANEIKTKDLESKNNDEIAHRPKETDTKIKNKSNGDFKKSLQSLEEIIEYCKNVPEENATASKLQKRKKKVNAKNPTLQSNANVRKEIKDQQRSINAYRKNTNIFSNMPEMRKMYKVILQDRKPQGISFKFLSSKNSKAQLLFIGNPYISNSSNFHRITFQK